MKLKLISLSLVLMFTSCDNYSRKEQSDENFKNTNVSKSTLKKDSNYNNKKTPSKVDSTSFSFVLSCGSGCALTYDLSKKHHLDDKSIELVFHITMYVNEEIVDEYNESYKIEHSNNKVNKIYSIDSKENMLEKDSPNLFIEIKKLSETLIAN